jgi:hypothetical protein
LHNTQSSLTSHVDKVCTLKDVFAEHDAIKREVGLLQQLVEKSSGRDWRDPAHEREDEEFGAADMGSDDDDARSSRTIAPHRLERVEKEDEDQIASQEQPQKQHHDEDDEGEERRRRRVELPRPRTPEPMVLGMSHIPLEEDDELRRLLSPIPSSVLDQLFEQLTTLSNQLESAVELSSNLQAQHTAAQNTISALESQVTALKDLVRSSQVQRPSPPRSKRCPIL